MGNGHSSMSIHGRCGSPMPSLQLDSFSLYCLLYFSHTSFSSATQAYLFFANTFPAVNVPLLLPNWIASPPLDSFFPSGSAHGGCPLWNLLKTNDYHGGADWGMAVLASCRSFHETICSSELFLY